MTFRSERSPRDAWGAYGRLFVLGVAFVAVYVGVDAATYQFPDTLFAETPWNPQPALALALIVYGGPLLAPAVFVAVLVAEIYVRGAPASTAAVAFACLGMALGYIGAGLAVRRYTHFAGGNVGPRDLTRFFAIVAVGVSVAAAGYIGAYFYEGTLDAERAPRVLLRLAIGDLLGLVVVAPMLLLLLRPSREVLLVAGSWQRMLRDFVLLLAVLTLTLFLVFVVQPLDQVRMSYLLFLPTIVFALRHGIFGAALAVPSAQAGLIASLILIEIESAVVYEFQMLMLTLAVTTLYMGALASERARASAALAAREQEMREQQARLNQAQRTAAAAELAAALAHELNQPLSAISTYASACRVLAAQGEAARPQLVEALAQVAQESARAGQFVHRMRDFFRTGTARIERTSIAELVATAHDQVRDRMARNRVTWRTDIAAGLPPVAVDRVQIGAVLSNLLSNAIDAVLETRPPRAIELRAHRWTKDGPVTIEVEDSGPGVAQEVRDRLFEPMATSKPEGMGLGLAMARTIAERHGGSLRLDTTRERTTFVLELPADVS
jgi:signal transduction histidine kinase